MQICYTVYCQCCIQSPSKTHNIGRATSQDGNCTYRVSKVQKIFIPDQLKVIPLFCYSAIPLFRIPQFTSSPNIHRDIFIKPTIQVMYLDIGDLTINIVINEALCTMLQVNHNRLIQRAKSQRTQLFPQPGNKALRCH